MDHLTNLMLIFALSVGVVVVFNRLRLPAVVGYLVTGAVAGPHGLGWVTGAEAVETLAEIGVALLLFTIGVEFSLEHLAHLRKLLFVGGGLQVGLTIAAIALPGLLWGLLWERAVFLGMLVALSSTAIVLKLLADRGEMDSPHGLASLAILIFQDLCVVPMVLLVPLLAGEVFSIEALLVVMGKALLVVGGALVGTRVVVPHFLRYVVATRNRETFLLSIILISMGTAWLTAAAGLSLALGAFIAGLVISESEFSHQALGEILPFRNVFSGIFFVSIGMLFNGRTILESPLAIGTGIVGLTLAKAAILAGLVLALGYSLRVALLCGLGLAQVGEFSFVLASVGRSSGLLSESLFQLFIGAAVLTMAATPLLWWISRRAVERFPETASGWMRQTQDGMLSRTMEERKDHVIIAGYGVNGRNLARVLRQVQIPYVVIEMNPEAVRSERRRGEPILYGDVANREVLKHAGVRQARVLVLAISDPVVSRHATDLARRLNPSLHIIVRTRYVREMDSLFAIGADQVIPEEFETSIEIFSRVLRNYLVPRDEIERNVREIRETGYEMFRTLHEQRRRAEDVRSFVRGLELEIVRVSELSPLAGRTLADAGLRSRTGVTVLAVQVGSEVRPNPTPETVLSAGTLVVLFGTPEQLAQARTLLAAPERSA
jgi:CPA2 family monovalent cation:H+ antiporter-2